MDNEYRVVWEIDIIGAKGEKDAAIRALKIQRDPRSTATVFKVARSKSMFIDTKGLKYKTIDLES